MKKIILSLVIGIFTLGFVSCKNEHEMNMNKMSVEVKKSIEDNAFKDNETFEFIEYVPIDYVIKPETYLDSVHLNENIQIANEYGELCKLYNTSLKNKMNKLTLYTNIFGVNDDLTKMEKEEFEDELKEFKQYNDSLNYYLEQDSLIRKKIMENTNPDSIYMFKVFIKGTSINKDNETYNVCDTLYYFFNKELKLIN